MSDGPASDKPHEPTENRLLELRRKGELARSADLVTAGAWAVLMLVLPALGPHAAGLSAAALTGLLSGATTWPDALSFPAGMVFGTVALMAVPLLAPLLLAGVVGALGSAILQRAMVLAPARLAPKLSRISPIANLGSRFGLAGLVEFSKSVLKLTIFGAVLGLLVVTQGDRIVGLSRAEPSQLLAVIWGMILQLLSAMAVLMAVLGAVDLIWQHHVHRKKNRMSHEELKDDAKRTEGDPASKQRRRQRAADIALSQVMREVPKADVLIVNPVHVAVALSWDPTKDVAPCVTAKGADHLARRMRELAEHHSVPIHRDPPTARQLYAEVATGVPIPPHHYRQVAAALRFADRIRRRRRERT